MSYGSDVGMGVEKGLEFLGGQAMLVRHPFDERILGQGFRAAVKLGPVAGGENRRFIDTRQLDQAAQGVPEPLGRDCQAFSEGNRSGVVVKT